jgi:DNA-directed RNA polymerase specialized sigma24 family protein
MKKEWVITQEAFDGLLGWLDADREQAALKYEKIRTRLIKIFTCRGCGEASDLADETINRVTSRVAAIETSYSGDPALYFYGVAQKVQLEYLRSSHTTDQPLMDDRRLEDKSPIESDDEVEQQYACLEDCITQLPPVNRNLVLEYYQDDKQGKIKRRKKLAAELGIALNALRIRAYRIRLQLHECVRECLNQSPAH